MFGIKVVEDVNMVDTIQAKTHRKNRINKKWRKRYGFIKIPKKGVIILGNRLIGHPATIRAMKDEMK